MQTRQSRRRPERRAGHTLSNTLYPTPEPIRKKFGEGWITHVPLDFLTDAYCANPSKRDTNVRDGLSFDTTSGQLFATSSSLDSSLEHKLSFDEWYQAWGRLLALIKEFIPKELEAWQKHFLRILQDPSRSELWQAWLTYDISVRRNAVSTTIDPATFQLALWQAAERSFTANKVRLEIHQDLSKTQRNRTPHQGPTSQNSSSSRHLPKFQSSSERFCFLCGSRPSNHSPRNCPNPHFLRKAADGFFRDSSGNLYCFSWNCNAGCNSTSCTRFHGCTLCGQTTHAAPTCTK